MTKKEWDLVCDNEDRRHRGSAAELDLDIYLDELDREEREEDPWEPTPEEEIEYNRRIRNNVKATSIIIDCVLNALKNSQKGGSHESDS